MSHLHAYNIVSVRRTPNQLTGPTYVELGPLYASSITIKDFKTAQASEADFVVNMDSLDAETKTALRDLKAQPLEVWLYRDAVRIFAGPVVGGNINNKDITLTCRGRLIYLAYMLVTADKSFAAVDQFTIGKTFVDDWQALDYGNYGVLTASIGTLGTTRSLEVPGATEHPTVLTTLRDFSKGSFDFWVDYATGNLEFAATRGTDVSNTVIIERGITNPTSGFALGPGLLASKVYSTGTSSESAALVTSSEDTAVTQAFGLAGIATNHDPVTDAAHLADLNAQDLAGLSEVYFTPGTDMYEVEEAEWIDLEPGNIVEFSYDSGLGKRVFDGRIEKRQLQISSQGADVISVEFE